jgi:hypothetical protein
MVREILLRSVYGTMAMGFCTEMGLNCKGSLGQRKFIAKEQGRISGGKNH